MTPEPLAVLRLLSNQHFVSGQALAQQLGCSRANIHNLMGRVADWGVTVHAVQGRGYRLAEPLDWLDSSRLQTLLGPAGVAVELHEQLPSTNAYLLDAARIGAAHQTVVFTEVQTAGRGRRGRTWLAPAGKSLAFSMLWRSGRTVAELSGLSLAVGVMLVDAFRQAGVAQAQVKWPNDILVSGAKLAGILIELAGDMLGPSVAVIGVGVNVGGAREVQGMLEKDLNQPVTDIASHGSTVTRTDLAVSLLKALNSGLARFEITGFAGFLEEWNACHTYHGETVTLLLASGDTATGQVEGVDALGALQLRTPSGVRAYHSGEVSLRGAKA